MKIIIISLILCLLVLAGCSVNEEITGDIVSDCPKGFVNDEYPGACADYVDIDNNQICDTSE